MLAATLPLSWPVEVVCKIRWYRRQAKQGFRCQVDLSAHLANGVWGGPAGHIFPQLPLIEMERRLAPPSLGLHRYRPNGRPITNWPNGLTPFTPFTNDRKAHFRCILCHIPRGQ